MKYTFFVAIFLVQSSIALGSNDQRTYSGVLFRSDQIGTQHQQKDCEVEKIHQEVVRVQPAADQKGVEQQDRIASESQPAKQNALPEKNEFTRIIEALGTNVIV